MRNKNAAMEKALFHVLAGSGFRKMPDGLLEMEIKGKKYFVLTDGYRIVRKFAPVPALPSAKSYTDLSPSTINRFFAVCQKETEMNLPTIPELKAWIKEKHIRRNNPGKTTFCLDGFVHVNPFFLLDMLQGLPNCKAYRPEKYNKPIYFKSENGDGLLCPVVVSA